jgi:glycosyltransferase involved in cell wall biosynthesis
VDKTSTNQTQIVGICQVRNEDVFIDRVLANITDFCDLILVADHLSRDRTAETVLNRAKKSKKIKYKLIGHPSEAHEMIRVYANSPTWVFPVDGDELYDPIGLAELRSQILRGDHNSYRQIYGHSMHCSEIDRDRKTAKGYLSPPCRTVTKLYNFDAIFDWAGPCSEKCLGGTIMFKTGYSEQSDLTLTFAMTWDESPFRLLHTCFLQRSSLEPEKDPNKKWSGRKNPYEIHSMNRPVRWINNIRQLLGITVASKYKQEKYLKGPLVERDVSSFFLSE